MFGLYELRENVVSPGMLYLKILLHNFVSQSGERK